MKYEKRFKKGVNALDDIFNFVSQALRHEQVPDSETFSVELAVEEIFTNLVKYNSPSASEISIAIDRSDDTLHIRLIDYNVKRFDITKVDDPELNVSLSERKVGGLGLYLTKKFVNRIEYRYENHNSIVTLTKNLGS